MFLIIRIKWNLKKITFWVLFFLSNISYAQYIDLGFRINQISRYNYKTNYEENLGNVLTNRNISYFSLEFMVEQILINNNVYRFRTGIHKIFTNVNSNYNYLNSSTTIMQKYNFIEYRFAPGIGKICDYKKIIFKMGLELPFNYQISRHNSYEVIEYLSNGNIYKSTLSYYDEPPYYYIGLYMFNTIYYNFWKSFSAGFELSNGLLYGYSNGTITRAYEYYDATGQLTDTDTINSKIVYNGFSTSFLNISIGLTYRF